MNRTEVLKLLAMASVIDPRVSRKSDQERSAMASAWTELLGDMSFEFAVNQLKVHYSSSTEAIMPADLIKPYKVWKRTQAERYELTGAKPTKMPDEVRALIASMNKNKT